MQDGVAPPRTSERQAPPSRQNPVEAQHALESNVCELWSADDRVGFAPCDRQHDATDAQHTELGALPKSC
jgi:hypothetical protein